ncbi:MAG: protein kinase [Myxococcales bacterium]|nr:protein kinase [Myxococcales bacterium]
MSDEIPPTKHGGAERPSGEREQFAPGLILAEKFRIDRLLARGAMGAVYEGTQLILQRRVAIKTLHAHLAVDPALARRFEREGMVASRVRHPHIVEVIDQGEHEGTPFLVMEFIDGEDLGARLERLGRLSVEEALEFVVPVCAAVASAHDAAVLHRDIKPQNIALSTVKRGVATAKLVDFGLSKDVDSKDPEKLTATKATLGTPLYMPPEAHRSPTEVDARSDQYSLAVVLYECVCGEPPFTAHTLPALVRLVAQGGAEAPSARTTGVPQGFDEVLLRAMSVDKSQRFPSVWAFGRALLPFATERVRARWEPEFVDGSARSLAGANRPAPDTQKSARRDQPSSRAAQWAIAISTVVACLAALRWSMTAPPAARPTLTPTTVDSAPDAIAPAANLVVDAQSSALGTSAPDAVTESIDAGVSTTIDAATPSDAANPTQGMAPERDAAPPSTDASLARRTRDAGRTQGRMDRPGHYSID